VWAASARASARCFIASASVETTFAIANSRTLRGIQPPRSTLTRNLAHSAGPKNRSKDVLRVRPIRVRSIGIQYGSCEAAAYRVRSARHSQNQHTERIPRAPLERKSGSPGTPFSKTLAVLRRTRKDGSGSGRITGHFESGFIFLHRSSSPGGRAATWGMQQCGAGLFRRKVFSRRPGRLEVGYPGTRGRPMVVGRSWGDR
jgi:hypothetical protein